MKLHTTRELLASDFTVGRMTVDGVFECFTLEPAVRTGLKVPNKTAVPNGVYEVTIRFSPHFQMDVMQIMDVPGFTYVEIHPGNSDKDTDACTLTGNTWDGKSDFIGDSVVAFKALRAKVMAAIAVGERVTIEIS